MRFIDMYLSRVPIRPKYCSNAIVLKGISLLLFVLFFSSYSLAVDIVRMNQAKSLLDIKTRYKTEILELALRSSESVYGPYKIVTKGPATTINRAILEVSKGTTINAFMAITTAEWEKKTLAIRIPLRRGLLKYRLLAVNKNNLAAFATINSLDDLKKLKVGLRRGWATTSIMKAHGFNVIEATTYKGVFQMLASGRVDYIPRGVNEVYHELETLKHELPNLAIEGRLALAIPAPYYLFISPSEPRLAQRLTYGLEAMVKNNSLGDVFYQYYADDIEKARLSERQVMAIENPYLPDETPLERLNLWFEHDLKE